MSKDIWHTGKEIPDEDRYIVVKNYAGLYSAGSEFEYDIDHVEKWAYFDDLLALETELERTRKVLDVAVDALKEIKDGKFPVSLGIYMDINDTLEQITALEQKDVKWNKNESVSLR